MANGNGIQIVGNVTSDPELKFTASGKQLVNFTLANNRRFKKGDDWEEAVSFVNCVIWGDVAEYFCASVQKGDRVVVIGRLDQETWETEGGQKRSNFKINVEEVAVSLKSAMCQIQRVQREKTQQYSKPQAQTKRPPKPQTNYDDFGEEPF